MRFASIVAFILFVTTASQAQNTFNATIKSSETSEPLPGATATVKGTPLGASANEGGLVEILNVPNGPHKIEVSFVGYETQTLNLTFPLTSTQPLFNGIRWWK